MVYLFPLSSSKKEFIYRWTFVLFIKPDPALAIAGIWESEPADETFSVFLPLQLKEKAKIGIPSNASCYGNEWLDCVYPVSFL